MQARCTTKNACQSASKEATRLLGQPCDYSMPSPTRLRCRGLASAPRIWYIRYAATGSPLQVAILVYPPSDDGGSGERRQAGLAASRQPLPWEAPKAIPWRIPPLSLQHADHHCAAHALRVARLPFAWLAAGAGPLHRLPQPG